MHFRIFALILSLGSLVLSGGCDRHSWEKTKRLHEGHGDGHSEQAGHEKADHAPGEKKESAHGEAKKKEAEPAGQPRKL